MARRMSARDKIRRYVKLVSFARQTNDVVEERRMLVEWIGVAKMNLDREQAVLVLNFLFNEESGITPDKLASDFILDTYAKEI